MRWSTSGGAEEEAGDGKNERKSCILDLIGWIIWT